MENIIFIGFKGAGKTSVGKVVAKRLGKKFFDSDESLEDRFFETEGRRLSFREIYKEYGAAYFRKLEMDSVPELFKNTDSVISIGGGTLFSDGEFKERVKKEKVVYLYVEPGRLFRRITRHEVPPFLSAENPFASFNRLFSEREKLYREIANIVIDNGSCSCDETAGRVVRILGVEHGR